MDASARAAWKTIRRCVARGRYRVLPHFAQRMDQRGMVWPDVVVAIEDAIDVRYAGFDDLNRARWIVEGKASDGLPLTLVCVLDEGKTAELVCFITLYWRA